MSDKGGKVKIILLGDSAVGKSKLMERFLMDDYKPQQMSTYALTLFEHTVELEGEEVEVEFWDTAGQEAFESIHASYYFGAHACILVFDCTRKITYKNLKKWLQELHTQRQNIPCLVAANKIDMDPETTRKDFAFAKQNNFPLYYLSASDGTNVVKLFLDAIKYGKEYKEGKNSDFVDQFLDLLGNET
eukprot:gb/GECH01011956.1/.p1 GENE.gb/GECH01011956.1/~~gb/GECH01011956.1/.p1  ORF type:complete len:188 (+),score=42.81 gb/GECH01011956.1/:1-564(+)